MFKFLRKTSLYILAIPLLFTVLGTVSNQAVLWANHDQFPVKWNDYKVAQYALGLEIEAATAKNPAVALHAEFDLAALRAEGFIDDTHVVMSSKTHLNFLADIWDFHSETDSIGDLSLDLGNWLMSFAPFVWAAAVISKLARREERE